MENVEFDVRNLETEEIDGKIYWNGKYKGDCHAADSKLVLPIHPNVTLNPPPNCSKFYFDGQLVRDVGVDIVLNREPASTSTDANGNSKLRRKCFVCLQNVLLDKMRVHIAHHIVKNDIAGHDLCGFCGREGCKITTKVTSRKSDKKYFKIVGWDCPYFYDYGQKKTFSKNNRTSNHLVFCQVKNCDSIIWAFNTREHQEKKHPGVDCPDYIISDKELKYLNENKQ